MEKILRRHQLSSNETGESSAREGESHVSEGTIGNINEKYPHGRNDIGGNRFDHHCSLGMNDWDGKTHQTYLKLFFSIPTMPSTHCSLLKFDAYSKAL
jgi:hypothetical protein